MSAWNVFLLACYVWAGVVAFYATGLALDAWRSWRSWRHRPRRDVPFTVHADEAIAGVTPAATRLRSVGNQR